MPRGPTRAVGEGTNHPVENRATHVLGEEESAARLESLDDLVHGFLLREPAVGADSTEHRLEDDEVEVVLVRDRRRVDVYIFDRARNLVAIVERGCLLPS